MVCKLAEMWLLDRVYGWVAGYVLEMGYRLLTEWVTAWAWAKELT